MHNRQRDFLLSVILTAASMTSATGKQQYAKHCINPGFFRHMEQPIAERLGAAAIGSRPGEEQVARAHRTASRSGRWPPTGRRL